MQTTDKSNQSTSTGTSTEQTQDRRFAYRKFVKSLLLGSVEDMKKSRKMEIDAIKWLSGESAGEILNDVNIDRKEILVLLKSILVKDGFEKRFYINKLEKLINDKLEDREDG